MLDVDGTLALPDHRVSPRALAALRLLQQAGVVPIVVTGRGEAEALRTCRDAGITALAADGDNDLDWLSKIGLAIAVANARPDVLRLATGTIGPNSADSVAELLELWAGRLAG